MKNYLQILRLFDNFHFTKRVLQFLFILFLPFSLLSQGSIIDHNCTDISKIPDYWIEQAKSLIKVHYAHTSHGSQITIGLQRLADPSLSPYDPRLAFLLQNNSLPRGQGLCIMDGQLNETYITPELYWRKGGDSFTMQVLNTYQAINVSMWAWCRQLDHYSEQEVNDYLEAISKLEKDYPEVTFVYMTGNAQATGEGGYNRYLRNEQIRKYCREKNKVLFDFADLDAWYSGEKATYTYNNQKIPKEHPHYSGSEAAHTTYESCENKGKAFWWMMAKLAGWGKKVDDCDYNKDGIVDEEDIKKKFKDIILEYYNWSRECWWPMKECADFNQDGIINYLDIVEKCLNLYGQYSNWVHNCDLRENTNLETLKSKKLEELIKDFYKHQS